MPRPRNLEKDTVRTTLDLPVELWRAIKIRALDERRELRAVLTDAVALYLRTPAHTEDQR